MLDGDAAALAAKVSELAAVRLALPAGETEAAGAGDAGIGRSGA